MSLSPSIIMRRAWRLLRDRYGFRRISGIRFCREAFAWCLRTAWAEARKAAAVLAMTAAERSARIGELEADLTWTGMRDGRSALAEMAAITAELSRLRGPSPYQLAA